MEKLITQIFTEVPHHFYNLILFGVALLIGLLVSIAVFKVVQMSLISIPEASKSMINKKFKMSLQLLFSIVALNIALPFTTLSATSDYYIHKLLYVALIIAFALLFIKISEFIKSLLYIRFDVNVTDNLDERKARTQIDFLQKLVSLLIIFIATAVILMSFSRVRELGTSILASAGIAGLIIGLAAQKSISNLLAGFQIAFTQPIRLDDVVIVENEWGRIEEITLSFVVVKIWDQRRLVLPISYFLEKPFQNWTRISSDILGTVFIYTDYTIPVDELRKELTRILTHEGNTLWDKKVGIIQITNTSEKGIELRILISSTNASLNWDLKCLVREQMITYIQKNFQDCLPRIRLEQQVVV